MSARHFCKAKVRCLARRTGESQYTKYSYVSPGAAGLTAGALDRDQQVTASSSLRTSLARCHKTARCHADSSHARTCNTFQTQWILLLLGFPGFLIEESAWHSFLKPTKDLVPEQVNIFSIRSSGLRPFSFHC